MTGKLIHLRGDFDPQMIRDEVVFPRVKDPTRLGHCYQLAGQRIMNERDGVLVHGTIQGPLPWHEPIGHAWVLLPFGQVWEPITDAVYTTAEFQELFRPVMIAEYYRGRAMKLMLKTRTFGPW